MFLFKPKEYVSCEQLEHGIHFDYTGLYYCGIYSHSNGNNTPVAKLSNDLNKCTKELLRVRKRDVKMLRSGKMINRCKDYFLLEKKVWEKSDKIKKMDISANRRCNSNCIYCTSHKNKEYLNSLPDIPIYNFLEHLIKKNKIDKNIEIHWGGGEPTLLEEFENIVDLFLNKTNSTFRIYSSGIKYSEHIAKAISLKRCTIIISIDSGNSELYKKIKNVDKFDTVVNNITKYCEVQEKIKDTSHVILKYIIIPGINDDYKHIYDFLKVAKNTNCVEVRCDLEQEWYKRNKDNIDKIMPLFKIMKYMDIQAKRMDLVHFFNIVPYRLIEMYTKEYETTTIEKENIK